MQIYFKTNRFFSSAVSNVQYTGIGSPIVAPVELTKVARVGFALEKLGSASSTAGLQGADFALGNIVHQLSGVALRNSGGASSTSIAAEAQRGIVRDGLGEIAESFFRSSVFSLQDIGDAFDDHDTLRQKLDDLDSEPGNVTKSEINGSLRFDIEINRVLSGLSRFNVGASEGLFAGLAELSGGLRMEADAVLRLVVGVDADGKTFIDPVGALDNENNPVPFITLSNIRGAADGTGRLGMFNAQLRSGVITTDPSLSVRIGLVDPNPDDTDAMIRLTDLDLESGELFSVAVISNSTDTIPDVSLAAKFDVKLFDTTLFSDRSLTFRWPDATNPRNVVLAPGSESSIFDALAAGVDQVSSAVIVLADAVEAATGTSILSTKIPLLNKTLGEVLNQEAEPLVIPSTGIFQVGTPIYDEETDLNSFEIFLQDIDLVKQGLKVGGNVVYQTVNNVSFAAKLVSFNQAAAQLEYPGDTSLGVPLSTSTFSLPKAGGLSARLRSLSDGISISLPTVQELIDHIARITGIDSIRNVQVVGTLGESNFGIQFPIQYVPDPIKYQVPLDFAEQIASLKLEAAASAQVLVQPTFNITIGISLAAKKADGTDFSPLERVYVVATSDPNPSAGSSPLAAQPIVGVNLTLQLDNPSLKGSVGFLDVTLSETGNPTTNKGIKLDLLGSIHLVDPDTGVADQRIQLNRFLNDLSTIVDFDFDGSLDIDGLTAAASVGSFEAIAGVNISLEGEGGDAAPGHFETLAELGQVLSRIQVGSFTNFDQFKNISAADVLAALGLFVEKLQATGRGEIFSKPIPVINRSVSDLIDLGQVFAETIGLPENDSSIATAAKFQAFLNAKLAAAGLPATVEVILATDAVRFKLSVSKSFPKTVPISFQFGSGGLSIDGDVELNLTATGTLNLTLGIRTAPGLSLANRFFLDTNDVSPATPSEINVTLQANAGYSVGTPPTTPTPIGLDVVLGPVGFRVVNGRILVGVSAGANLQGDANKRIPLSNLGAASITPSFNGSVQAIIPIDGDNSGGTVGSRPNTLTGDDALILVGGNFTDFSSFTPEFATTSGAGLGNALPTSLTEPIDNGVLPQNKLRIEAHKVVELINSQFLNFGTLIEGLERLLDWGDRVLDLDILDKKIPFIGKTVRDGLNFLESDQPGAKTLRTVMQALVTNGSGGLKANDSNAAVDAARILLRDVLAGIPGISPISDFDLNEMTDADDLIVPTKNGAETTGVIVRFKYKPTFTTNRTFDLGIDFLNLNGTGNVELNGNLELNIGFGVSKTEGFFFVTDLPQPEFKIGGSINPNLTLNAELGRLDVDLSIAPESYLSVDFSMNVVDPSGDGKLTLSELGNFSQLNLVLPSENVQLNVETHLVGTFETKIDRQNKLPSFSAGLNVDWRIPDITQTDRFRGIDILHLSDLPVAQRIPQVKIVNVTLDVGSFVTSIIKPIFQKITESHLIPVNLKNALDSKIPLIDKVVKDLLRDTIQNDPNLTQSQKESRLRLFDLFLNITTFLSEADSFADLAKANSLRLNFGDINVGANALDPTKPAPTPTLTDAFVTVTQNGTTKPQDAIQRTENNVEIPGSGIPVIKNFVKKLGDMGIFFPILKLSNLVQLIVGNDTDIVLIDLPELKIEKLFNQNFNLLGGGIGDILRFEVSAFLGGGFTFTARIAGGFDTTGLRNGRFVDGFYLGDFNPNSPGSANGQIDPNDLERPEISFVGFVQAGIVGQAEVLGFDVAKIEGYFKLNVGVNVDLNDDNEINGVAPPCDPRTVQERHDGKLHFSEIADIRSSHGGQFLSILELSGEVFAEVGLHVTVAGGLLYDKHISKRFDLMSFTGLTFPVDCPGTGSEDTCSSTGSDDDDLGRPILSGGLFNIDIPAQDQDQTDPTNDPLLAIAEDFNGNPFDGGGINTFDPDDFTIAGVVDGFSFTRNQAGTELGSEGVQVGQGVTFTQNDVELAGVVTNVTANSFTVRNYAGARPAAPRALATRASISMFSPNETLVMQRGGTIETFGPESCGENNIPNGMESIGEVGTGDDEQGLGPGNNIFQIHPSVKLPIKVNGGRGNDTIIGGSGPIIVVGGPGNDTIDVGSQLFGGRNPIGASIRGGSGRDTIFGGRAGDILIGEEGDDMIFDDASFISSSSAAGNDTIVGGGGRDNIVSRGGNDELTGDYHEVHDSRPVVTSNQNEDADIIRHESNDKAIIFGDNRGAAANTPGARPSTTRNTENGILTRGTIDEIFSSIGDKFEPTVSKGIIRITESLSNPILRSNSLTATGLNQLGVAASNTIEVTNATGVLNVVADSAGSTATITAIANGLKVVFANGPTYNVQGVSGLSLTGAGGSDTLVFDFASGNPIPVGGATFVGQTSGRAVGDRLHFVGTGAEQLSYSNRGTQSGTVTVGGRSLRFSGTRGVEASKLGSLSWVASKTIDSYTIQSTTAAGNISATSLAGTSNGNTAAAWTFYDISNLTLDMGSADLTASNDIVLINTNGLQARGLNNLKVMTGDGSDSINVFGTSLGLPTTTNRLTIDAGIGADQLTVTGDVDFSLNGDTNSLSSAMLGNVSLSGIGLTSDQVQLVAGASSTRFILTNWPGAATLDGGAGTDFLTLAMRGGSVTTVDELTLSSNVTVNAGAAATIGGRLNLGSATRTFNVADGSAAQDFVVNAILSGSVGLSKSGLGTMLLKANNTYSGTTAASAGTLLVDGTQSGAVTVNGGTIGGKGRVGAITSTSGSVSPGASPGILSTVGAFTLGNATTFRAELNGTTAGSLSNNHDNLNAFGTVNLGNSTLVTSVGFSSLVGNTYRILDNDGADAVVGTFNGLPEGGTLVANGFTFQISYRGGTGNDVVLTHIRNFAPAFQDRTVTSSIFEDGLAVITGKITEPDTGDLFTLVVDWGDGGAAEEFNFDPVQGLDVRVEHRYKDDPSDQASDERIIALLWRDQHGASNVDELVTTIQNVVPNVVARPDSKNGFDTLVKGNGQFTDPGTDSWFATIDFGTGQGEQGLPLALDGRFNFEYRFTEAGLFNVKLKVTDDDGGVGECEFPVRIETDSEGQLYALSWRNRRLSVDVNDDGEVAPLDVLLVINELSRRQSSTDLLSRLSEFDLAKPLYVDTNGDSFLAPLDVLLVINYLAKQSRESVPEGEAAAMTAVSAGFLSNQLLNSSLAISAISPPRPVFRERGAGVEWPKLELARSSISPSILYQAISEMDLDEDATNDIDCVVRSLTELDFDDRSEFDSLVDAISRPLTR